MSRKRVNPTTEEIGTLEDFGNPFTANDFVIKVRKRKDIHTFVKDSDGILMNKEYLVEVESPTKLYPSPGLRQLVALLSAPSKALLFWIMFEMEPGKDYVVINQQRYMAEHQQKTDYAIQQGLFELSRYRLITPTVVTDVYWVDPRYLFNGSRLKKYRKHKKVVD